MSNRKRLSAEFIERTTAVGGTFTPPPDGPEPTSRPRKHYAGIPHRPSDEEADRMAKAIADAIFREQAADERASG